MATRASFQPKLQFLMITIHLTNSQYSIKALVDSGCAKTAISLKTFQKLQSLDTDLQVKQSEVRIQTCDGSTHKVDGTALLTFSFDKLQKCPVQTDIMIVAHLADDMLLGSDILSSSIVQKTTPTSIFFENPLTKECFQELFLTKTFPVHLVKINRLLAIKPYQFIEIKNPLKAFKPCEQSIWIEPLNRPSLQTETKIDSDSITVQISNYGSETCFIPMSYPIATITTLSNLDNISTDEYMNDVEREQALENAKINGYFQPSVSAYIEGRNMITEADKIEIPPERNDEEFLQLFDLSHFSQNDKLALSKILVQHRKAFSMHKYDIGKTNVLEMDIEITVKENRIQKYTATAMNVRERANEILAQMEQYDIIRECHEPSPYVSNILVIPKKDNVAVRLLFDGRLLNYDTKRLPMSLITKGEILSKLIAKTNLSSLDFADAFYQIPLSKQAQPLTAFWTPNQGKRMCFNRAPQGLRNSPLYLKMVLDKVFYDLDDNVIFYADDLLVATDGPLEVHFQMLNEVLTRLTKAGLKLRPQKMLIARQSIEFLGMIFERQTLKIPDARLEAFKALPSPTTGKELKSALCAFSYYRHFIPHFASLTHELMTLSALKKPLFKFTPEHEKQYRHVIQQIADNAKTHFPDPDQPFYIQTDASKYCAGGRLYQKDEDGNELLIAAVSKTFTKCERNYAIYKKEGLALL